ncbi:DMT family transporter [Spirosoma daeguense]
MNAIRSNYWLGAFLVFLAAFCFATKGILIKLAYQYPIDSITLLTLRMLFSLPFYLGVILSGIRKGQPVPALSFRQWGVLALLGITGYYFASFFNFLGLVYITASLERIVLFVYPTFVLLMNAVGFGRRITLLQVIALILTYTGIVIAFRGNIETSAQKDVMLGVFWVVLSGVVYAIYLVGSDRMIAKIGTRQFTCYAMIAATIPTVVHCFVHNGLQINGFPTPVYLLSIGMAIFVTVIPTFMIAEGIKRIGSGNASIIASIGPIFTIILSTYILQETISFEQIIGTLFVLTGVFLIGWRGK